MKKSQISVTSRSAEHENRLAALLRENPIIAKRLSGNVFGGGSKEVPLKEKGWYTRIDNTLSNDARFYELVHELGYVPLRAEDLSVRPEEIGFRVSEDGGLVRGKHGEEKIFKMPQELRDEIDRETTRRNKAGMGSASVTRSNITNAASAKFGDEGANYLDKLPGQVIDTMITGE